MPDGDISLVVAGESATASDDGWLEGALRVATEHRGRVAIALPVGASASDVEALDGAGVDIVHVDLLGKTNDEHDYHAGFVGAFAALGEVLSRARSLSLEVVGTTPVTRSNFRSLRGMLPLLEHNGIRAWRLSCLRIVGPIREAEQRMVPRIGMALPHVLQAVKHAGDSGIEAFVEGAPLCAMGPFADRRFAHHAPGGFAEVCGGCDARPQCGGVDPRYLERFGAAELRPRPAAPDLRRSAARDRYAAVFVEAGGRLP